MIRFTKLSLPCHSVQVIINLYTKTKSKNIFMLSALYNFPLHQEVGNLIQAQTSAVHSVREFRFSS